MSLEMEEVGGNGNDLEFENNPEEEEEESSIPNAKKPRGKNKTYILMENFENKLEFENVSSIVSLPLFTSLKRILCCNLI